MSGDATAAKAATSAGGSIDQEQWEGPGFVVRNAVNPEGNVFHIRKRTG